MLKDKGFKLVYINGVRAIHENMMSPTKIRQRVSQKIKITRGLRQDSCIAPILFNVYFEGGLESGGRNNVHLWAYQLMMTDSTFYIS